MTTVMEIDLYPPLLGPTKLKSTFDRLKSKSLRINHDLKQEAKVRFPEQVLSEFAEISPD